ncbi:hypothetical protein ACFOWZ_37985 [Lentzea rhizosphaerae]|uniref:MYXO-CTERM domain-containing protein n=1 Tax=Lentzea rhizosphaerae TaxID=2041025 RepID=A0ABV8C5G0_9PSEU|nr:hypothetical protein [Lentzea aerocolonigenes]MCP2244170.1 hypothetical protein [Lentzea aerocolonigenes]
MTKEEALSKQENTERVVTARSGLGLLAGLVVLWVVLRWIRHG